MIEFINKWARAQFYRYWSQLAWIVVLSFILWTCVKVVGFESVIEQHFQAKSFWLDHAVLFGIILFVWSFILFTTFVPLGTLTILIAGHFIGVRAGFIQFGSMLTSGLFLYAFCGLTKEGIQKESLKLESFTQSRGILRLFSIVKGRPILTVCALRVIPVIPSAACVLICHAWRVSLKNMMLGTLAVGWMRPVFFSMLGAKTFDLIL